MTELADRLRTASTLTPGAAAMEKAAQRAAESANATFAAARYPAHVQVIRKGSGWRLQLAQTARVTRPLSGRTPMQVVREAIARELPAARRELIDDVTRMLHS